MCGVVWSGVSALVRRVVWCVVRFVLCGVVFCGVTVWCGVVFLLCRVFVVSCCVVLLVVALN